MEAQRHWRSAADGGGVDGCGACSGGESSSLGGRLVSSASKSSVGELAAAWVGVGGSTSRASVPHFVVGPNTDGSSNPWNRSVDGQNSPSWSIGLS
jgi:hypothetical protein